MSNKTDVDVAIIGGGPAGAGLAAYLGKAGASCAVFEKEQFPRPHVGESLVPASTRVFKELGFLQTMEDAGFPHKFGAAWTTAKSPLAYADSVAYDHDWQGLDQKNMGETYADVRFDERDQDGVEQQYTYHVDRGKFDHLLLNHAAELGADVREGVAIRDAQFGPEAASVSYRVGGKDMVTTAQVVVDASGRRTLLGSRNKWKVNDPVFDQYAVHAWFEDYDRTAVTKDASKREYIFIHFLPITNTWVWQIPITDTVTSIGVVTQKRTFKEHAGSLEEFFWQSLQSRPEFYEAVKASTRVRPFATEGDYSYSMREIVDDRLLLVGDAARFVDPIFSTGVSIALNSARFASWDILAALEHGDFGKKSFHRYEQTLRRGEKNWYEFINVYYRLNVLFTVFVLDERYRLDVLKLLQGDVYDEDAPEVLARMRRIVGAVERNPDHMWHNLLGDLTSHRFEPTPV